MHVRRKTRNNSNFNDSCIGMQMIDKLDSTMGRNRWMDIFAHAPGGIIAWFLPWFVAAWI